MSSLLEPGSYRGERLVDDQALVRAMLRVEVAWLQVLADAGAAKADHVDAVSVAATGLSADLDPVEVEAAGNPVLPLVRALQQAVGDEEAMTVVHCGLTSQDVLDTALMLLARDTLDHVDGSLVAAAGHLARLAAVHRGAVMVGRTLTQYAVPVTFGLKAAQWLEGVLDAAEAARDVRRSLPVQLGGAAGTLALAGELVADALAVGPMLADQLGLSAPTLPWHTRRTPVTRVADALVQACDAVGVLAADVALLGRPEIAEVREGRAAGRGVSSTMPHKRNPVLAVLIKSAALQAPQLGAQLHLSAGQAVDERPDGAWHAEWPAYRRLLGLAATATSQAAELVSGLEVDVAAMAARVRVAGGDLLAERGGGTDPAGYLGASTALVDRVLARWEATHA
ncbi:lyase family protein [Kribbella catacumbae]|uniref:lyase family protein n=1 Tax=Kribbella catacumbae TaxID=460086 RepID=UPI000370BEC6|nr:lyase family protein [Kribbella catacumbae]